MRTGFHGRHGVTDLSRTGPREPGQQRHPRLGGGALRCGRRRGAGRTPGTNAAGADISELRRHLGVDELGRLLRRVGRRRGRLRLRLDRAVAVCAPALHGWVVSVHRFVSMGCDVVVGGATTAERRGIERLFVARDETFSRFRPDSELNRVNDAAGIVLNVSAAFAEMVAVAMRAARVTDGLVDPTLGAAIEAAGYDRDFSELTPSADLPEPGARGRWRSLRLRRTLLHRPRGVRLDLNGVVKGKTVDDALAVIDGGLATSSIAKRRWLRAGIWQHHLIDPRTGRPCETPWQQVTVSAATCLQADVAAKAALLSGDDGSDYLARHGL